MWHQSVFTMLAVDVGESVVRWIVDHDDRPPTPARFHEVRRSLARAHEPDGLPALGEGDTLTDAEAAANVNRVRSELDKAMSRRPNAYEWAGRWAARQRMTPPVEGGDDG